MNSSNEQTLGQLPLAERLASVSAGISAAVADAGRATDAVTTIVVTKFHPASLIEELYALGVRDVGENRHQEASAKASELASLTDLSWHFVGQLQSKKARQARQYASVVHSVDRPALVSALDAAGGDFPPLPCFVQVNLTDDEGRGGVQPDGLEALVERVLDAESLELWGVMAVAPLGEEPRAAFARLRGYSERVIALEPRATRISAGMSHDYTEAILEGATHLRIGTAITGNRPSAG
ncbi:pyridoxal phosphate enzyme (YggS family) [Okibacterium sp. HSC-33S16]|uniref:YggS family pyridoxal phosphate-dependent enzyme n=1 Tax=Okibacterium sp. HSC-33S16 TaxID=2910965 RepID=UPI0020A0F683|nr:YggS family pyridoxal phosphate-dependent enzyme [Okibacterium sp. HSC-33S16]MCP2032758.1 pyridoxal phosphate enzyme (YggS family) [Okibacterium sp. HSC-33S16]